MVETSRGAAMLSMTILSFSASLKRRRRPVSTTSSRLNALSLRLSIRAVLSAQASTPQGGPHQRHAFVVLRNLHRMHLTLIGPHLVVQGEC